MKKLAICLMVCASLVCVKNSRADFLLEFEASDFALTPFFSDVQTFNFRIDIADDIEAGGTYVNPTLNGVVYRVFGSLEAGTPSGFTAFNLERTIGGAEFYTQGSSLSFQVAATADFTDGLQVSELVGVDPVFVFNGREVDTGRYHPALFELNGDGTGSIRNSNNFGGVNPFTNEVVDVEIGEEYITLLEFDPGTTTIGTPEPSASLLLAMGMGGFLFLRRRRAA